MPIIKKSRSIFRIKPGLSVVFSVLLSLAVVSGVVYLKQQYVLPIVMYHSVNPEPNPFIRRLIVSPQTFRRQMGFLKRYKYNVISLAEAAALIRNKEKIPARTIVITFDDGYKDNYTYAYPVLKEYNFPATIFVIIEEIGRDDRLNWKEIKEMQGSGLISFGSHALGPEPLINIDSPAQVNRQIFESKKILDERLGRKTVSFSYPEGRFNDSIRQMVIDAGYDLAVATSPGKEFSGTDLFLLKRIRISENAANMFIFAVETSGLYTFMKEYRKK